jgi:hypothetical protein
LADVNGDGALDAVVGSFNYSGVATLLNTGANQVTISSSTNPSGINGSVTFTATVTPEPLAGSGTLSPSGTVTFTDNGNVIGSGRATLVSGQATITTSYTLQGTHIILATYSGDTHFVGNTKATLVQNVNKSSPAKRYTLSATPTSATLSPGQSAQFTVTATPLGGDKETIFFNCPSVPAGMSCTFSAPSITLNGSTPSSVTLTISVAPTFVASNRPNDSLPLIGTLVGIFGCVALGSLRRNNRARLAPVLLLIALTAILAATGCGGTSSTNPISGTSPKVIHVLASSSGQGSAQQLDINITVQ